MKKILLLLFVIVALVGCTDDTPDTPETIVSFATLNQNSTVYTPPVPPAGSQNNKTYLTPIVIDVSQEKKLGKVTINSLRLNVLNYTCDQPQVMGTLSFIGSNGGVMILLPLKENSELDVMGDRILSPLEELLESNGQAVLQLSTTFPVDAAFDIQVSLVMNANLQYMPFRIP